MKKFIATILSSTMIFTAGTSVFANDVNITDALKIQANKTNLVREKSNVLVSNNIPNILVNGKELKINEGELLYENNKFIPIRELADTLGLKLDYIPESKIVVLDNGKIQLPIDNNKASVNGKIVSIDENNEKICTLIVNNKSYIPVNFVNNVIGYNVQYNEETQKVEENKEQSQNGVIQLNKSQALEAYKKISEVSQNIKNATIDMNGKIKLNMSDGTDNLDMIMDLTGTVMTDIGDKVQMYSKQTSSIELMGEKQDVIQEMFYKDGKMYVKQNTSDINEFKYKMDLNLDEAVKMSNTMNIDEFLTEDLVSKGAVENLENGNKKYTFNLNIDKAIELVGQFSKEMNLGIEDLKQLDNFSVKDTNVNIIVDSNNNPLSYDTNFSMLFSTEGITIKADVVMNMKYNNVGNTVVKTINEDLSQYQDIKEVTTEETTA